MPYVSPKPLLMIIAEHDMCTFSDIQRDIFAGLSEPKKLVSYAGGHFDAYIEFFDETAGWGADLVCATLCSSAKPRIGIEGAA